MRPEKTYQLDINLNEKNEALVTELKDYLSSLGVSSYAEDSIDSLDELSKEDCQKKLADLLEENYITDKITLYSYSKEQLEDHEAKIKQTFAGRLTTNLNSLETSLWAEGWKDSFKVIETDSFLVCPPWDLAEPKGKKRIIIEPALAFGTGQHATTQVCLKLLENYLKDQAQVETLKVLDLGTGSGILSVAAAKENITKIDAIDIEEDAVQAAKTNANLNAVSYSAEKSDLQQFKANHKDKSYNLIFANILLPVLVEAVPAMTDIVEENGQIILSGLITSQREEMEEICKNSSFELIEEIRQEDWIGLRLIKKS